LIIEDDYDGEYRYGSGPVPSLQGLDRTDSVIYIGTFAKVLFPSLRLAYMVVPKRLAHTYEWAKKLCDNHCQMVEQYALADFIDEGLLERHAHKMRAIYEKRRQVMLSCIREFLGDKVQILGENAGLHVTLRLPYPVDDDQVLNKCAELGVRLKSTKGNYLLDSFPGGEFLLGYANVDEDAIREGVRRLASVVSGLR
jgi:GntR family transcriptional regulator / MocR family aminotransferase